MRSACVDLAFVGVVMLISLGGGERGRGRGRGGGVLDTNSLSEIVAIT